MTPPPDVTVRHMRDRIDPDVRVGLDGYLTLVPGGISAIPDLRDRRAKMQELLDMKRAALPPNPNVEAQDHLVPGPGGAPDVRVRVYRPVGVDRELPGLFVIHGGGMTMGSIESEDAMATELTERVGCVTVSVDYRLAPEHPHPAPVEDCYAALLWATEQSSALGLDAGRLAIYGLSAGGGLAAATTLLARDRGGPDIAYQMLISPMLDDRNTTPSSYEITDLGTWSRSANLESWQSMLGPAAGTDAVSAYAAPARATDLTGLPSAFVESGELDLFRDENIDYAARLFRAGVATELHVYPGTVHGTEVWAPTAPVSRRMVDGRIDALRRALWVDG